MVKNWSENIKSLLLFHMIVDQVILKPLQLFERISIEPCWMLFIFVIFSDKNQRWSTCIKYSDSSISAHLNSWTNKIGFGVEFQRYGKRQSS